MAMETIGLRELRQNASEYVKRAEGGEELAVTVAGRPAAVLGPPRRSPWRTFDEIRSIFAGPGDPTFDDDRALLDQGPQDPWAAS